MAEYRKKCIVCNKEFITNKRHKKTCDSVCSKANHRRLNKENRKRRKTQEVRREKRVKKKEISELARIEQLARQHGMTYGNYVGIVEKG